MYVTILFDDRIIFYLFYIVRKAHEAQMLYFKVLYLLWNLIKHRCYGAEIIYFVFSSEMENRTLYQMHGSLYLPTFLFRVGLLTLIFIASFMALAILCPSLPIILKLSTVILWPECVLVFKNCWRCFQMSFIFLFKCSGKLPYILIITFSLAILKPVYDVTLFCYFIFVVCEHQLIFQGIPLL